jgi:hypothetical protein
MLSPIQGLGFDGVPLLLVVVLSRVRLALKVCWTILLRPWRVDFGLWLMTLVSIGTVMRMIG